MAEIGTAYVKIEPTAKGIVGKLNEELGAAGESGGKTFGAKFGSALGSAGKVAAGAVAGATAVVGAFGKAAATAGSEYESAFAQVGTIMDTSVVSTQDMSNAIQELSSSMGISANELSNTVYNAISATGDTANAVSLAGQASKLATAGFTDTGSALSVLTTAMNAYGLSADEASNISDSLIAVQNLGVTTVSELSSSMGKAIASASAYNVNLTNLESAYVSLTKGGINTAESTTYISSMLKELGSDGSAVSEILKSETGKSFATLMNEGSSLGDVLGILNEAVDGDATAMMNLWSSAEAGKASNAILSQGLDQFNDNLKTISESAGMTQTAYETMADTLEHKTDVFKTLGTNLLTSVYSGMSEELGTFVDFGNEALQAISEGFESGGFEGAIEAFGTVISDGLAMIMEKIPDFVEAGVQLLESLGQGLMSNLPTLISSATQIVMTILNAILENLPSIIEAGLQIIAQLALGIAQALPTLVPTIVNCVLNIVDVLIANAPLLIEAALALIQGLAEGLITALPQLIERLPEIIQAMVDFFVEHIADILIFAVQLMVQLAAALIKAIPTLVAAIPKIINSLRDGFMRSIVQLQKVGTEIVNGIKKGIEEAWGAVVSWVTDKVGELAAKAKAALKIGSPSKVFADEVGRWIPAGIAQGIENGMGTLDKQIKTMTDDLLFGTLSASANNINSVNYVPSSNAVASNSGRAIIINNEITVNGAEDPEAWTQGFIRTLKREARMA